MAAGTQKTLFALDCGATNWRLYRSSYKFSSGKAELISEPQISPLTSFSDRKLPAVIMLNPKGKKLESMGEIAQQQLEDEENRGKVREYFKPCIGNHLAKHPLPHQKRFTHAQALNFTRLLLDAVVEQIRTEKWRSGNFDERVQFTFAYPVHWQLDHDGAVFDDFRDLVLSCFPQSIHDQVRFVAEPEGAILSLQRQRLLSPNGSNGVLLITDVGGSTTDIVAGRVDSKSGDLQYIGRYGEPFGGGLYDDVLAKFIADTLKIPASVIADQPSIITTLRLFSRRLKESLSRQKLHPGDSPHIPQRTISLVLGSGEVYRRVIQLSEDTFNEVAGPLDEGFRALLERAMNEIGVEESNVDQVVLVGGGAQLFSIVQHLRARFGEDKVVLSDNPEEIVVQGIGLEYGASFTDYHPTISLEIPQDLEKSEDKPEPPSDQVSWTLVSGEEQHTLESPGTVKVGRDRDNDIHVNREKISRVHAEIRISPESVQLVDLNSTNGTYVNDVRLSPNEPTSLQDGDIIRFGDCVFKLERMNQ